MGSRIYFSLNQANTTVDILQRQPVQNAFPKFLPGDMLDFKITFKQAYVNIWRLYEKEMS